MLTGFICLDNAAVGQLFQQAEQVGFVVAQARPLVALADAVDADGAAGERGTHQPLPQLLAATEAQHVTYSMLPVANLQQPTSSMTPTKTNLFELQCWLHNSGIQFVVNVVAG